MQIKVGDKVKFSHPVMGEGEGEIVRIDVHQLGRPGWDKRPAFDLGAIFGYRVGIDLQYRNRAGVIRIVPAIFGPDANGCTIEVLP